MFLAGLGPVVWVAVAVAVAVGIGIAIWRIALLIPGAPVAKAEAKPSEPYDFELEYTAVSDRAYRLAVRMRLHSTGTSGFTNAGILCRYRVELGDKLFKEELIGVGADLPRPPQRRIEKGYMMADTRNGTDRTHYSIRVLTEIPTCPAGTRIRVTGEFEPKLGTETSLLEVFLGR